MFDSLKSAARPVLSPLGPLVQAAVWLAVLSGCGQGGREGFIAGRVLDRCDTGWPVCDRVAGCLLGDQSYIEGKLPGSGLLAVQVFELSTVRLSFYLESVSAAGTETALSFFEDKCRSRIRQTITGRIFVGEAQKMGWVYREAELSGVGDHLIEFSSDTRADYLAKVEVIPKRIQTE